jgi:hypothetical protein
LKKIRTHTPPQNKKSFYPLSCKIAGTLEHPLISPYLLLLLLLYIYIKQGLTEHSTSPKTLFQVPLVKLNPLERWNTFIINDLQRFLPCFYPVLPNTSTKATPKQRKGHT